MRKIQNNDKLHGSLAWKQNANGKMSGLNIKG